MARDDGRARGCAATTSPRSRPALRSRVGAVGFEENLGELPLDYGERSGPGAGPRSAHALHHLGLQRRHAGPGHGGAQTSRGPCCACSMASGWSARWRSRSSLAASTSTGCRPAAPTAWRPTSSTGTAARGGLALDATAHAAADGPVRGHAVRFMQHAPAADRAGAERGACSGGGHGPARDGVRRGAPVHHLAPRPLPGSADFEDVPVRRERLGRTGRAAQPPPPEHLEVSARPPGLLGADGRQKGARSRGSLRADPLDAASFGAGTIGPIHP